ncbi:MAG: amino acid permease [Gaiellales bacterium]
MTSSHSLGIWRGGALYVGALVGPGLLLVPALATKAAGPASIVAWVVLLVLSAPLAATFVALGVRHPVSGGVAAYARAGLGHRAAAITGTWFIGAGVIGGPAVARIGGNYIADLTDSGTRTATAAALVMCACVIGANALGLRVSSGLQLGLSSVLVVVIVLTVGATLPAHAGEGWHPFAPQGWLAVGTAANILMWLFVGWEAMAQLAGEFRRPAFELPRAATIAYAVIAVLYLGLAVATITVTGGSRSEVPLADLIEAGFGHPGRTVAAILAAALTMGTMNVYMAGTARLAAALARDGALPAWVGAGRERTVPWRPLAVLSVTTPGLLLLLAVGVGTTTSLVRASSACFVAVYLLALTAAVRMLSGRLRLAAVASLALVVVVAAFSSAFILVPVVIAGVSLVSRRRAARATTRPRGR